MFKLVFGSILFVSLVFGATFAQDYQDYETNQRSLPVRVRQAPIDNKPTPVPILKQINRHNEDGSYTYGYEGADGSFKIETKLATGEVKGKYGYVDETGKVRVVEYGANKYGFQPSGEGITVAPPTLVDETTNKDRPILDYEDGSQTEKPYIARVSRPQVSRPAPQSYSRPQFIDYEQEPEPIQPRVQQYIPQAQAPAPRPQHSPAPAPPRLQIPGAQKISGDVVYSSQQRPARPDPEYTQSQTFSLPQQFKQLQRPIFSPAGPSRGNPEPQQSYVPRQSPPLAYAAPSPPQGRSTSVLDQLAKDYALPQGGAQPLHDISFGYY